MDQARERFLQYLNRCYGRSTTPKCYASDLDIFLRIIYDKEPEAVTAADMDAFMNVRLATGLSSITINRRLATVHTFFEYLASECPDSLKLLDFVELPKHSSCSPCLKMKVGFGIITKK